MAKYIEFVGVSGVGKSTTYQFLMSKHSNNISWMTSEKLNSHKKISLKEALRISIKILASQELVPKYGQNWDAIRKFSAENPELVDLFWSNFPRNREAESNDARFHIVGYILKIIEKLQQVYDHPSKKYILVDEGFIHNLNYLTNLSLNYSYSEQVNKALDHLKLPVAVVYFTGNLETVLKRTSNRGKINYRDNGLSIEELKASRIESISEKEMFIEAVSSRNIPVLHLKSNESVAQKSFKIIKFIIDLKKQEKLRT